MIDDPAAGGYIVTDPQGNRDDPVRRRGRRKLPHRTPAFRETAKQQPAMKARDTHKESKKKPTKTPKEKKLAKKANRDSR